MSANEILSDIDMTIGTASKSDVVAIYRAADDGGTIQAGDMVDLFPGEPERHNCTSLTNALLAAGCERNA